MKDNRGSIRCFWRVCEFWNPRVELDSHCGKNRWEWVHCGNRERHHLNLVRGSLRCSTVHVNPRFIRWNPSHLWERYLGRLVRILWRKFDSSGLVSSSQLQGSQSQRSSYLHRKCATFNLEKIIYYNVLFHLYESIRNSKRLFKFALIWEK